MNINKNKGMYLETIINNSIEHYKKNKIALFRKLDVPVKIIEKKDNNVVIAKIYKKSDVDYYGVYKGRFIAIEAKQTENQIFYIQKMPQHQIEYLNEIDEQYNGISILILHFSNNNNIYCFPWIQIKNITKIINNDPNINKFKLNLFFPGRIDFLSLIIKNELNNK